MITDFYKSMLKINRLITSGEKLDEIVKFIFINFKEFIPCNRIGIALLDAMDNIYSQSVITEYNSHLNINYSVPSHETSLYDVISKRNPRIINNYLDYLSTNPSSKNTRLILEENLLSSLAYPISINEKCLGVLLFSSSQPSVYNEEHLEAAGLIAESIALSVEKDFVQDKLILSSVIGFTKLVESRDNDTGQHIERIQNYCKVLAEYLLEEHKMIDSQFVRDIYNYSPLHDIGKVGIADGILLKPARLSPEEFEVIKKHTIIGSDILKSVKETLIQSSKENFDMAIDIALSHHEKFNGKGYPIGLAGSDIPLAARIVSVADVFDALTSKRVYKSAFDIDTSISMIVEDTGNSFDPIIVDALLNRRDEVIEIYRKLGANQ